MKIFKSIFPVLLSLFLLGSFSVKAQRGHGHGRPHGPGAKVVVVKRSPFRPKKVIIYHPVWGPRYALHRRWIFFPKYNFYWDNWRGVYLFNNGVAWVAKPTPPTVVVNVNLQNEKHYELKDHDDDIDDVYKKNDDHKKEYKLD